MSYKAMYKNEIARAAGVSRAVFRVWLKADKQALEAMGITPRQQLLPPVAVRYLCEIRRLQGNNRSSDAR